MKRFVSILITVLLVTTLCSPGAIAKQKENDEYLSDLSALIQEYSDDNYFGTKLDSGR